MRHLIAVTIALSLALITASPSGAMMPPADPPTDCAHHSADVPRSGPHHGAAPDLPGNGPIPCCAGICFVLAILTPAPTSLPAEHLIWHVAHSSGIGWNIEPADPPPRR